MVNPACSSRLPKAGEAKRGSDGYLAYLLRQANAATRLSLDRELADLGVTLPQFSALMMISVYQPLSSADVARLTMLTPQTVNGIIQNLEQRRAIARKPHPTHGRILNLELTEEGVRLLKQCRARADRVEHQLRQLLPSKSDAAVVSQWLAAIPTALGIRDVVDGD